MRRQSKSRTPPRRPAAVDRVPPAQTEAHGRRHSVRPFILPTLVLIVLTLAAYAPVVNAGYIWDEVEGVLATDRPNQFKLQLIYNLPFGTSLGVNEYVASGIPKTREIAVISSSAYPMFYMGRGSDGRMPTYSQTDVYVQHQFKLSGSRSLALSLNVLNLFNQQTATNYFQTENKSGYTLDFDQAAFYAHQLDFNVLKQQQGMVTDARFMMNQGWQTPINARIGVKFLF